VQYNELSVIHEVVVHWKLSSASVGVTSLVAKLIPVKLTAFAPVVGWLAGFNDVKTGESYE
jgi:hypothetical protein